MSKILIIEDDAAMRETLKEMLERKNYEVITAENGDLGCKIFRKTPTDLIITDIIMPVKGGIHAIVDLQQEFHYLKIIAISGGGTGAAEDSLKIAKALSVNHTLSKPFSNEALLRAVRDLIG